jgi:hypothetical protein
MYCLVRLNILKDKTITANIPSGCAWNDFTISPRNKNDTDRPNPHPGQKSKPKLFNGQIDTCVDEVGS